MAVEAAVRHQRPTGQEQSAYQVPFWSFVRLGDGVSPTASDFPEFDDETRTDRVFSSYITARGELFIHQWDDHTPCRARIAFDAQTAFQVNVQVLADGAGLWYLDINGNVTSYTTSQYLTLSFRKGQNVVTIIKDDANTDRLLLEAVLFDGTTATWVPPGPNR
jgi:hypothetical protein